MFSNLDIESKIWIFQTINPLSIEEVESVLYNVKLLEDNNFFNFKLSVKSSDIFLAVKSYEMLSGQCNYPLHLGITEAGGLITGSIKSSIGMG